jgi:hypothetical protein
MTAPTAHSHDPHAPHGELPLLRYRDGGEDGTFEHPVTIMGHVTKLDYHVVTIHGGRDSFHDIYLEDLYDLLGGPEMTMNLLVDAAEHHDEVKIELAPDHLAYVNPHQRERLAKFVNGN